MKLSQGSSSSSSSSSSHERSVVGDRTGVRLVGLGVSGSVTDTGIVDSVRLLVLGDSGDTGAVGSRIGVNLLGLGDSGSVLAVVDTRVGVEWGRESMKIKYSIP